MGMNWLAIAIATIAAFGFGSIYYMSLAGPWLDAIGRKKEDFKPTPTPFIISIVANLVMAIVLAGLMRHVGPITIRAGAISGALCWLGFVVTTTSVNYAFGDRRPKLTIIDSIHWLGVLVIQGAVIGAFGT
jgi:MFS family permease